MKNHRRIDVTLTLLGPILTRGGQSPEPGIDAPLARDGLGRPMLPFSLIKGKVRDALAELRPGDPAVADWLGRPSGDANRDFDPERGRLRFTDFTTAQPGTASLDPDGGVIERIQIDAATGSAAARMLMMIESPFGYGEPVEFRGAVEFVADDPEAEVIRAAVEQALRWVPSYGAMRTVGFGRTSRVETATSAARRTASGTPAVGPALPLRLKLDRPLCLVGKKHSRNHFESLESIPGAVLKGATARLLLELAGSRHKVIDPAAPAGDFRSLWRHFEAVRFAEARPMTAGAGHRPVEPPLSVVTSAEPVNGSPWHDVALEPGPRLVGGRAPAFRPDWKDADHAAVRGAFGWPKMPCERRTRTAIDEQTGRAADEQLFSYGLVLPEAGVGGSVRASFVWETEVGLEGVEPESDRAAVAAELAELLAFGLPNVGKTRAVAAVTWLPRRTPPAVGCDPPPGGVHAVTLQTDCLMTDPELLRANTPGALESAYRGFWHEASGGSLELVRYFARQSLHGGYLARRFGREGYEPFLVTDRGSTFVLRETGTGTPGDLLGTWHGAGLPVPGWVKRRYVRGSDPLWKVCPFLPHAGFGEVAVDLSCHTKNPPPGPPA